MITQIRYKKKWFNPLYFELRKYMEFTNVRYIFVYGGKSSAKTVSICQILASKAVAKSKNTIAYRKESTLIPTTIKKSFNLAIETHRLSGALTSYDRSFKSISSEIVLKGLDKEEKVKGTESYDYLYFDELNQFEKEEFDQANLSLRGREGQKILASWNPVNINSWIKKFLDKRTFVNVEHTLPCKNSFIKISDDGKIVLIKTTYEDNYWIAGSPDGTYGYRDENLIYEYIQLKEINENLYNVNVLGEWGIDDPNKLFAKDYKPSIHFGKSFKDLYRNDIEVYLAWDFNIDNTCLAIQNIGDEINVLKEYHIKGYDLSMLCEVIKTDFAGHEFIINGDASGHARSALTTGNATAYNILQSYLDFSWDYQFFVPASNPSHLNSRLHTNTLLKFFQVNISAECKELDIDLRSVEVDDAGKMDVYKKKNPGRTHWLDPFRYHIHAHHRNKIQELTLGNTA
jgi:hypothetical protein